MGRVAEVGAQATGPPEAGEVKRSALKRGKPLQRTARLKVRGKSRFPKRRDLAYTKWIRTLPCLLWARVTPPDYGRHWTDHSCWGALQVCHVRSRGAGGDDRGNVVPLCARAHAEQHRIGIRSFQARWGIDLKAEAERLYQQYVQEQG